MPGEVADDEYPDIEGVFVTSLTSDASPAALGHIQAGDVLTEVGDSPVSESSDIAEALGSLQPGAEVAIKLYRDGETITTRVKIADPSHEPFGQKAEAVDQGFLGLGEVERRCCIPGTKKWGLEIDRIIDNSPADLAGLQKGDVITEFDGPALVIWRAVGFERVGTGRQRESGSTDEAAALDQRGFGGLSNGTNVVGIETNRAESANAYPSPEDG